MGLSIVSGGNQSNGGSLANPHHLPPLGFFVQKKGSGLRPYIDYCGLNAITVRYQHPLPLVVEQLHGLTIYTKLDLRSAYNLVRVQGGG